VRWPSRPASAANAVTTAYERLIADGFAVATTGSGTFVAARIPAQATAPRRAKIMIEPPQHSVLSLGCTHIDERALQRFRAFAGRRLRAFGPEHLHYGDPGETASCVPRSQIICCRRADCAAIPTRSCWRSARCTRCASCSARS